MHWKAPRVGAATNHPEREADQALAPGWADSRLSQWLVGGLLWLTALLAPVANPADVVAVLRAEDAFDFSDRRSAIAALTLVIGGDRDRIYSPVQTLD